jgi:thiazole tautomerase (transcriptional regulator TenI)
LISRELHIISTGKQSLSEFARIAGAILHYADAFHLREKTMTARELVQGIEWLAAAGVPLEQIIVNDRADVAAAMGVRGVHLAHHSLDTGQVKQLCPSLRIGKSVHSEAEAVQMEAEGADYLFFGHIFPTKSKADLPARGTGALKQVVGRVAIPIIAIGGITPANVQEVIQSGAAGIAVMSGIMEAKDPVSEAAAYHHYLHARR